MKKETPQIVVPTKQQVRQLSGVEAGRETGASEGGPGNTNRLKL